MHPGAPRAAGPPAPALSLTVLRSSLAVAGAVPEGRAAAGAGSLASGTR